MTPMIPAPGTSAAAERAVPSRSAPASPPEMDRWRDAVLAVQSTILSGTDVDGVLVAVAEAARGLARADLATVALPHLPARSLILRATAGYRAEDLRGVVFPIEESLSGQVLCTGEALHLPDASANANAYQPICDLGDLGPALLLPLERGQGAFGTLLVARRHGQPDFEEETFRLLEVFAGHVSVAVEFCRNQEELQRFAQVEESERIGRELHDTVLQRLFGIGLQLQALSSADREVDDTPLQWVLDELDETVREIRSTVLDSGPR